MRGIVALTLLLLAQLSATTPPARAAEAADATSAATAGQRPAAPEAETLKERLSDKASDEQRIDNCRVAPDRRGATPRPDCAAPRLPAASGAAGGSR